MADNVPGMPWPGQRLRLVKPHPWSGVTGTVYRRQWIGALRQKVSVLRVDPAPGLPQELFITGADEWKPI